MSFTCKICGSKQQHLLYKDVPGFGTKENFDLSQCDDCSIIFTTPVYSLEQIKKYYDTQELAYNGKGDEQLIKDYQAHKADYWARLGYPGRITEIQTQAPQAQRLLDVGCGAGFFLDCAAASGYDCAGLEISAWGHDMATKQLQLSVLKLPLSEVAKQKLPSQDVVTMYDVLEHSDDPIRDLTVVHKLLRDQGILVVNVPNIASFISRLTGKHWVKLIPPNHTFFFEQNTLRMVLEKAGFEVVSLGSNTGDGGEFMGEVLAWPWREIGHYLPAIDRAYAQRNEAIEGQLTSADYMVKGTKTVGAKLGLVAQALYPMVNGFVAGEGLHVVARKA